MGGCSSKSTVRTISPEAQARRFVRQNTSTDELQRQLSDYHSRPRRSLTYEKRRPSPIAIENPAGPGSLTVSVGPPLCGAGSEGSIVSSGMHSPAPSHSPSE